MICRMQRMPIFELGIANSPSQAIAKNNADADARNAIARTISVKVSEYDEQLLPANSGRMVIMTSVNSRKV